MKTHFKKLRNPDYLGSWDLADENGVFNQLTLKISNVKKQMVFDGKGGQEECVVIHFEGKKPMIANATNLKAISFVLNTPYIEEWIGQQIILKVEKVKAFGEIHDALRVVRMKVEQKQKKAFTEEMFEKAFNANAQIELIKEKYITTEEILTKYQNYVTSRATN